MTPEKAARLREEFPSLFPATLEFDIGDGWFELVRACAQEVAAVAQATPCQVRQVKQKLGCLTIYAFPADGDKTLLSITDRYRELSQNVCETCGQPGRLLSITGYLASLCSEHAPAEAVPWVNRLKYVG